MRHPANPFGTVEKIYSLLTPDRGTFMSTGFFFKLADSDKIKTFPPEETPEIEDIVRLSNASLILNSAHSYLHNCYGLNRGNDDVGHFLMMRTNEKPLNLPLHYTGDIAAVSIRDLQCASATVTEFKPTTSRICAEDNNYTPKARMHRITRISHGDVDDCLYCVANDEKCELLSDYLTSIGLYEKPKVSERADETVSDAIAIGLITAMIIPIISY